MRLKDKTGVRLRNAVFEACMEKLDLLELGDRVQVLRDLKNEVDAAFLREAERKARQREQGGLQDSTPSTPEANEPAN